MVIVFKDLNRQPQRITTIPMECLETIKHWLDTVDILYSEGPMNLKWQNIIDKIKNDPEGFIKEGGWDFLHESVGDEESDVNDGDSSFKEEEYDEEEASEYVDEDSDEEYEDSDVEGGESELSDRGLDWDELEENAAKSDREYLAKHNEEEINNPKKRKKVK